MNTLLKTSVQTKSRTVPVVYTSHWAEGNVSTAAQLDLDTGRILDFVFTDEGADYVHLVKETISPVGSDHECLVGSLDAGTQILEEADLEWLRQQFKATEAIGTSCEGQRVESAMKILHVHVAATNDLDQLAEEDESLPGVYEVEVSANVPAGMMVWGALQAIHEKQGAVQVDDFEYTVVDPETDAVLDHEQIEPTIADHVAYTYNDKIEDTLPSTQLVMTIKLTFQNRKISLETLKDNMHSLFQNELDNGGLDMSADGENDGEYEVVSVIAVSRDAAEV